MELVDMLEMVQRINYSYTFIFKYVDNRLNFFIIYSSGVQLLFFWSENTDSESLCVTRL